MTTMAITTITTIMTTMAITTITTIMTTTIPMPGSMRSPM